MHGWEKTYHVGHLGKVSRDAIGIGVGIGVGIGS